ncbi:MAG: hypothetical protein BMS9Abin36_1209 [Gammaproteobacteria bacterium]|nr:MAG: hypothetical protein BMS9Abin36_1209 [Gammaproteobacteria bacterium]
MKSDDVAMDIIKKYSLIFIILIVAIPSIQAAEPDQARTVRATLDTYGIYAYTRDNGKTWINPLKKDDRLYEGIHPVLIKETYHIPAIQDLFFGFEYVVAGLPDGKIPIEMKVSHPQFNDKDGKPAVGYSSINQYWVTNGKAAGISGYIFERDEELKGGDWVFDLRYNNQSLLKQVFKVIEQ